ncbi:Glutamate--cysteine ligase [Bathymodiolus heckerae thiotrophic gill symbiont]|uniref:cyanophycin synthetase n=1 Tax=Bathymodiolus heckerae thiotrophic gill symbiont TaxID=1052212 RepID=UPI0010B7EE7E|nr:cyanophycin synthetase [Bathymodiolus heckerae thiotrophic gill symbiont]SMN13599.1 Glutamate--cysteine ligase [Bathymodiolus heckerae thiotrophic gill symbiont]SMN16828.1 Glutamate--cysteine ligase [uncultured Candidatus Thioglobus sp.]
MQLLHKFLSRFFLSGCSDYNPLSVRRACRSKAQARQSFEKNNLPYAKGTAFISPVSAFKFAKKNGFPLAIKPNVGGFSRGAYFPIQSKTQLLKASFGVKKWWPVSIVEEYLLGKNYRVVMTKFGVMSVLRRYPPFVIGDGKNSISTLIDMENAIRVKMDLLPVTRLIPKNSAIKKYLKSQNMNLANVLNSGQKVYLHPKISLKLGSSIEVLDNNKISEKNLKDLKKILDFFNANILGIDVICKQGVEVDFDAQACIFLELNARPFLKMHDKPRYGKAENLSEFYDKLEEIEVSDNEKY